MPRSWCLVAAAVLGVIVVVEPVTAQLRVGEIAAVAVESPHPYPDGSDERPVVWTATIRHPGATFLKLHFARFAVAGSIDRGTPRADYVALRDGDGVERHVLTGIDEDDRWAPSVRGDTVEVVLHADASGAASGLVIDRYGYGTVPFDTAAGAVLPDAAPLETRSVCGSNDIRTLCDALEPTRIRTADPVARVLVASDCGALIACTGFLFDGHGDLMTNAHCVNSAREAHSVEAWFNDIDDSTTAGACALPTHPSPDLFQGAELLAADCARDVAIIRLDRRAKGNPADVYGFLELAARPPIAGEPVWVPQHPGGGHKEIADVAGTIAIEALAGTDFCGDTPTACLAPGQPTAIVTDLGHTADTRSGSSGSPVLDASDRVIALHHGSGCGQATGVNSAVRIDALSALLESIPTLAVRRVVMTTATPARLRLDAAFSLGAGTALDPSAVAVRLEIADDAGAMLVDAALPAGNLVANARGTQWRFNAAAPTGSDGITRVRLRSHDGRRFKLVVKAAMGVPPVSAPQAFDVTLRLGVERFSRRGLRCNSRGTRSVCQAR